MQDTLRCDFCFHKCLLHEQESGPCGVRKNIGGKISTLGYGQIVASGIDPIEKKPMYHFFPGSRTFSFALFGCNYTCGFCQNNRISQTDSPYWPASPGYRTLPVATPQQMFAMMEHSGTSIMSYTYSEPIVWQDYMFETAQLVHEAGKFNCMVTNGSFSPVSLERALNHIDAFNIDVKGDDQFYRHHCAGALGPVLDAVEAIASEQAKVLEVTTLLIEGIHTRHQVVELAAQLHRRGVQVWHLSRFFPQYHMADRPATSERFLAEMLQAAQDSGIPHVYSGNSGLLSYSQTTCPSCHRILIKAHSYAGEAREDVRKLIKDGHCSYCGTTVYGRFDQRPTG